MKSWVKILLGLILGLIVGLVMGPKASFLAIFGKIFINLLTMLVIIIIFSSLITGICHMKDPQKLGRVGFRTIAFYFLTTIFAIATAILLAYIIKPGKDLGLVDTSVNVTKSVMTFSDFFLSLIPSNPFASFAEGNILQVIIFAIFLGVAITVTGEKSSLLVKFFEAISHTMHKLTHFVMLLAPYGIFALMASTVGSIGLKVIVPLFQLLLCNYIGCFLQLLVVFPFLIKTIAKLKVVPFFKGMKDAIVLAFSTSSSSATLPVSLECAQKHLGVSEDMSGFILSLGSTVNMNGAAIGQAISAIFIAQAYGIELTIVKLVILVFISLFSAIGAAGIPGTGIIMLSLVLSVMGLPLEGIALVAGVDRLREMVSSVVNVLGDAAAAVVISKQEGELDTKTYHKATWMDSDI
jgi:dicarboxylate/amino acid:cation (Na+ or H+) symporter, DAACS family